MIGTPDGAVRSYAITMHSPQHMKQPVMFLQIVGVHWKPSPHSEGECTKIRIRVDPVPDAGHVPMGPM